MPIEVLLGPAVCGECYEVPAAMRAEVDARLPGSASRTRRGTPGLDLRAGLYRQLASSGVARIGVDPRCTFEDRGALQPPPGRPDGPTGRGHLAGCAMIAANGQCGSGGPA